MSDVLNEQLSALIDGELPAAETALLLKRLERDPALREQLARYQALGDVLRGATVRQRPDFARRVSAALADEPAHAAPAAVAAARTAPRALRLAGGLAVAASVALLAILTVARQTGPAATPAATTAAVPAGTGSTAPIAPGVRSAERRNAPTQLAAAGPQEPLSYVTPGARPALGAIPPAELANYVVAHSSVSGMLGVRSVLTGLVADEPVPEAPRP